MNRASDFTSASHSSLSITRIGLNTLIIVEGEGVVYADFDQVQAAVDESSSDAHAPVGTRIMES